MSAGISGGATAAGLAAGAQAPTSATRRSSSRVMFIEYRGEREGGKPGTRQRRDFFFGRFFATFGFPALAVLRDLRAACTSASTRSPSSGPINPRRTAYRTSSSASSVEQSPMPAAPRIALTSASATGLRSTLAIPGRASSSEEICDPPSSAGGGIEHAAPALKVAPSYIPPFRPSRIFAATTVGARGYVAGAALRRGRRARAARW